MTPTALDIIARHGGCIHDSTADRAWFTFDNMTSCGRALRQLRACRIDARFVRAQTESPMLMVWG